VSTGSSSPRCLSSVYESEKVHKKTARTHEVNSGRLCGGGASRLFHEGHEDVRLGACDQFLHRLAVVDGDSDEYDRDSDEFLHNFFVLRRLMVDLGFAQVLGPIFALKGD